MRTLAESKVLAGTPGHYRLTREVQKVQVPATVQAVLAARIDRLPIESKRLLQAAAVIGKDVSARAAAGDRRSLGGDGAAQPDPAPGRRVPVRDQPLPERGVHLPPRADPRGGLLEPAAGSPAHPARPRGARRWSSSTRTGCPSTSSGSPTTRCAARCGRRRWPISARRGRRRRRAPRIARRSSSSSRRWPRSGGCPRADPPPSWRSTCAWTCGRRCCSWASSSAC